ERLFVIRRAHHGEHRAEDLFLVDAHLRRDVIEETAAEEIAALVALQREAAPVDDELRAFRKADIDIAFDALVGLARDERPHLGIGIAVGAELQAPHARRKLLDQSVARLPDRHGDRYRHAAL